MYRSRGAQKLVISALAWRRSYRFCTPLKGKPPCRQMALTTLLVLPANGQCFHMPCRSQPISIATLISPLGTALEILQPAVAGPQVKLVLLLSFPRLNYCGWYLRLMLNPIHLQVADLSRDAYFACKAVVECIALLGEGAGEFLCIAWASNRAELVSKRILLKEDSMCRQGQGSYWLLVAAADSLLGGQVRFSIKQLLLHQRQRCSF